MLIARWIVLMLLGAGAVCFAMYLGTGQQRYRLLGVRLVRWTVIAGLAVFAVLVLEWLAVLV